MKIEHLPVEFVDARKVLQVIEKHDYEAYFVGGSVRDTIIGLPIHDVDMATSAYPAEIKQMFKRTIDTGIEHGTITVMFDNIGFEITTFRTETGYQDYRRPDQVNFVRSLKEDLKRRDFTINALAMRENGDVIDLFDGIGDLRRHLIRAVGDPEQRFNEDALRMMRAVRFGSQLDFTIESDTFNAIKKHSSLLKKIAIERINVEFVKMMLGFAPGRGIQQMLETDMFNNVPFFDRFIVSLKELVHLPIAENIKSEDQVWSLFSISLKLNYDQIKKMMRLWKCSNKMIETTLKIVMGCYAITKNNLTAWTTYEIGLGNLLKANQVAAVFENSIMTTQINDLYQHLPIKHKNELKINGSILIKNGFHPGPNLGKILSQLEHEVIDLQVNNDTDKLLRRAKKISNNM